jgi:prolyl oligopeptidase
VPLHSYKFISQLQYALGNEDYQQQPLLIRIEVKAGHGGGKPTSKVLEEAAETYAFITLCLGVEWRK